MWILDYLWNPTLWYLCIYLLIFSISHEYEIWNGRCETFGDSGSDSSTQDLCFLWFSGHLLADPYSDIDTQKSKDSRANSTRASDIFCSDNLFGDAISKVSARIGTCVG